MRIGTSDVSENWDLKTRQESGFISNLLSGAKDKNKSVTIDKEQFADNLNKNINECAVHINSVHEYIKECNFRSHLTFLKINSPGNFSILISIVEDDFLNPGFLKIYKYAGLLEEKVCRDNFNIDFSFLDFIDEINVQSIYADGFTLKLK